MRENFVSDESLRRIVLDTEKCDKECGAYLEVIRYRMLDVHKDSGVVCANLVHQDRTVTLNEANCTMFVNR